ncbi:MAG TPA: hypothetical protein V6D15_08410 [Oculatellaceae cyanobacterium]|jgi:hypothetical protein
MMSTCLINKLTSLIPELKPSRRNFPALHPQNSREIALQPAQNQINEETYQRIVEQLLKPNYSEYSLKDLRTESREHPFFDTLKYFDFPSKSK